MAYVELSATHIKNPLVQIAGGNRDEMGHGEDTIRSQLIQLTTVDSRNSSGEKEMDTIASVVVRVGKYGDNAEQLR